MYISILRTGAATAVAAKYLSRHNASTVTICGCGNQGKISLLCLAKLFPLKRVFVYDIDEQTAQKFAEQMSDETALVVEHVSHFSDATLASDICVTCTPSKNPYLRRKDVAPGTFIAAVGSDNEDKQELDPSLLSSSILVTDVTEQCASIGELHHAIRNGMVGVEHVHAELGEIVAGKKPGRRNDADIIIFDSTGMALQDVAAAAIVYERAVQTNTGTHIDINN